MVWFQHIQKPGVLCQSWFQLSNSYIVDFLEDSWSRLHSPIGFQRTPQLGTRQLLLRFIKGQFIYISIYLISFMYLRFVFLICWYRTQSERTLQSQARHDTEGFRFLDQFSCRASLIYHHICGSLYCWEQGGRKQFCSILIALADSWWIVITNSYMNNWYDHVSNCKCCNHQIPRLQPETLTPLGVLRGA